MIISVLILIALSAAWYLPVYKAQGQEDKLQLVYYIVVLVFGMLAVPLSIFISGFFMFPINYLFHPEGFTKEVLNSIFSAGIAEELAKFFVAFLIIQKLRPVRKIDAVLLCGVSGIGFNIIESLLMMDGILSAFMRGICALHITTMYWTGGYWWESIKCKEAGDRKAMKRNLLIGFLFPMVFHAIYDIFISYGMSLFDVYTEKVEQGLEIEPDLQVFTGVIINLLIVIVSLVFDVYSFKKAKKTAVASQTEAEKI